MLDYDITTDIKLKTNNIRSLKLLACSQELLNEYKQIQIATKSKFNLINIRMQPHHLTTSRDGTKNMHILPSHHYTKLNNNLEES